MAIVKKCRNSSYILQVIRSPGIFAHSYDHPFFGQLSLAGMLAVTDYPPDAFMPISSIVDASQAQKWVAKTYLFSLQTHQPNF